MPTCPGTDPPLILDLDSHALTWAVVAVELGQARLLGIQAMPHLGLGRGRVGSLTWSLTAAFARAVAIRRFRGGGAGALGQLDGVLDACAEGRWPSCWSTWPSGGRICCCGPMRWPPPVPRWCGRPWRKCRPSANACREGPIPLCWCRTRRAECRAWSGPWVRHRHQPDAAERALDGDDFGEGLIDDEVMDRAGR